MVELNKQEFLDLLAKRDRRGRKTTGHERSAADESSSALKTSRLFRPQWGRSVPDDKEQ